MPHASRGVSTSRSARRRFDIVGDVHGCLDELLELLSVLGYRVKPKGRSFTVTPPAERTLAFVGDLVDRGPASPGVLRLAMRMVKDGQALCVCGNRDAELLKVLNGRTVKMTQGVTRTLEQLAAEPRGFCAQAERFLVGLTSYSIVDRARLVIAHAGLKQEMQGRPSAAAHAFALRGETTGKKDESGMPIRSNWAAAYRGQALVVYGHTPKPAPVWLNNTVDIDTGCVYGGYLTALRYPELETVSVPARAIYHAPRRPFPVNKTLQ
jgi:protein phosphatase